MTDDRDNAGLPIGKRVGDAAGGPTTEISRKLRALYDSVQGEPIPERFLDLLEKLDEVEEPPKKDGAR